MRISSWHRKTARILAAVLLVLQAMLAAHACMPDPASTGASVGVSGGPAAGHACAEPQAPPVSVAGTTVPAGPAPDGLLCRTHCEQGLQTAGKLQADVQAFDAAACLTLMAWPVAPAAAPSAPAARFDPDAGPPIGAPPLYLAYAVLRR